MPASDLEAMGLDINVTRRRFDFLAAYAVAVRRELTAEMEREGSGTHRDDLGAIARDGWGTAVSNDRVWALRMDAATAHRDAAQWAVYLDPGQAQFHLRSAADLYIQSGAPYGAYLAVVSMPTSETANLARDCLDMLEAEITFGDIGDVQDEMVAGAPTQPHARVRRGSALPPQQAAYAFLAAAGNHRVVERNSSALRTIAETSPHRSAVTPVGSLGTPLRIMWDIARRLAAEQLDLRRLVGALEAVASRYAEAMSQAQVSDYLWRHAASPVDVGNIELVGIAALIARRERSNRAIDAMVDRLGPIASAPVRAGLVLAEVAEDERPR